ncbi:MAG: MarR family transcriptional regulator [Rhodobacteraceae bacterium]|nr:MarR family transcriptional regulator [Paracoccaceae bacterium]
MTTTDELPDEMFLVEIENEQGNSQQTLSFSRSPTVALSFAANRFTRAAARVYQSSFGVGAMDWRMLVMLTRAPGSSVATASRTIGIDKGAVSRSLGRLEKEGLATAECNTPDERRKDWTLTPKGQALHDDILSVALQRQKKLLKGFSPQEVRAFNDYLQRFLVNLDELNKEES